MRIIRSIIVVVRVIKSYLVLGNVVGMGVDLGI